MYFSITLHRWGFFSTLSLSLSPCPFYDMPAATAFALFSSIRYTLHGLFILCTIITPVVATVIHAHFHPTIQCSVITSAGRPPNDIMHTLSVNIYIRVLCVLKLFRCKQTPYINRMCLYIYTCMWACAWWAYITVIAKSPSVLVYALRPIRIT